MEIEGDVKNLNRRKRAENLTPVLFLLLFIVLCCILIPFNVSAENIPEVVTLPEFPYIDVIAINQKSFCDYVREKNFENALKIINDYIQSLSSQYNPDDHLYHGYKKEVNVIKDWIASKDCVKEVESKGIVETFPPQICFKITFNIGDADIDEHFDLVLSEKLQMVYRR
ncbi:MAG: hypothetical protein FJ241_12850 [Nitrospira sp.]|nr:hypothetical protein [Nitrospira sp.]